MPTDGSTFDINTGFGIVHLECELEVGHYTEVAPASFHQLQFPPGSGNVVFWNNNDQRITAGDTDTPSIGPASRVGIDPVTVPLLASLWALGHPGVLNTVGDLAISQNGLWEFFFNTYSPNQVDVNTDVETRLVGAEFDVGVHEGRLDGVEAGQVTLDADLTTVENQIAALGDYVLHTVGAVDEPAFASAWAAGSTPLTFAKMSNGMVVCAGVLDATNATGSTIFTLPTGFRPPDDRHFTAWVFGGGGVHATLEAYNIVAGIGVNDAGGGGTVVLVQPTPAFLVTNNWANVMFSGTWPAA